MDLEMLSWTHGEDCVEVFSSLSSLSRSLALLVFASKNHIVIVRLSRRCLQRWCVEGRKTLSSCDAGAEVVSERYEAATPHLKLKNKSVSLSTLDSVWLLLQHMYHSTAAAAAASESSACTENR